MFEESSLGWHAQCHISDFTSHSGTGLLPIQDSTEPLQRFSSAANVLVNVKSYGVSLVENVGTHATDSAYVVIRRFDAGEFVIDGFVREDRHLGDAI